MHFSPRRRQQPSDKTQTKLFSLITLRLFINSCLLFPKLPFARELVIRLMWSQIARSFSCRGIQGIINDKKKKKKTGALYSGSSHHRIAAPLQSTNMLLQRRVTGPSELLDWVFKDALYLASLLTNHVEIKVMNFSRHLMLVQLWHVPCLPFKGSTCGVSAACIWLGLTEHVLWLNMTVAL